MIHASVFSPLTPDQSDTHSLSHTYTDTHIMMAGDSLQKKGLAFALVCSIVLDIPDSLWLAWKHNLMSSVDTFSKRGVGSADGLCMCGWLVTHGCQIRGRLVMTSLTADRCCTRRLKQLGLCLFLIVVTEVHECVSKVLTKKISWSMPLQYILTKIAGKIKRICKVCHSTDGTGIELAWVYPEPPPHPHIP